MRSTVKHVHHFVRAVLALVGLVIASPMALLAQGGCTTGSASGASCGVPVSLSITTPSLMRITVSSGSAALGTPTVTDFAAGFNTAAGPTVTVWANQAFHVSVVGAASTFTYAGSLTNPNKPASDLQWATVSGSTYPNNMSAAANLFPLNSGPGGPLSQQLFFKTLWSFTKDVPGTYSLVVSLTVSGP